MANIKNKIISGKISEDERKRVEMAMNSLYKKGELPRNTTSCLIRKAVNELADEELEGKKEKREEELEKMGGKMRRMENKIGELETENQRLKDEKISLERKQKNDEKLIGVLSSINRYSWYENKGLMIENANLKKENQDLKGYQLSPEVKEGIDMYKEVEKCECLKIAIRRLMNK